MEGEGSGNRELVKKEGDEEKSRGAFFGAFRASATKRRGRWRLLSPSNPSRLCAVVYLEVGAGGAERKPTPVFGSELGDGGIFLKECTVSRYRNLAS